MTFDEKPSLAKRLFVGAATALTLACIIGVIAVFAVAIYKTLEWMMSL